MADLGRAGAGDHAANLRHQPCGDDPAFLRRQRYGSGAAEGRLAAGLLREPFDRLVDGGDRGLIAFLGRIAPGEQAVAFQNDTLGVRVVAAECLQPQAELEAGPPPGQPADGVAEDLLRQRPGILCRRDRDDGVGVHVIDEAARHIGMQRRVDRGCARIEVEGAVGQVTHHFILVVAAAIETLQRFQPVHVERGEAVELDGPHVAARSLDPQDLDVVAGKRVLLPDLRRGVAAAVIGDALVRAEQVGAVDQPFRFAHRRRPGVVPQVCKSLGARFGHDGILPAASCAAFGRNSGQAMWFVNRKKIELRHCAAQNGLNAAQNDRVAAQFACALVMFA